MLELNQIMVIFAVIQGVQIGAKDEKLYKITLLKTIFLLINIVFEIITRAFIAYNFTGLFILWLLVSDPEVREISYKILEYIVKQ
jgi:hypothetical protein